MKIYYLDGERVKIDKLRDMAKDLEGLRTTYLADNEIIRILRCQGLYVEEEKVCGSLYSSLQWFRP